MRKEVSLTAHPEYCRTLQCSGEALRAPVVIVRLYPNLSKGVHRKLRRVPASEFASNYTT